MSIIAMALLKVEHFPLTKVINLSVFPALISNIMQEQNVHILHKMNLVEVTEQELLWVPCKGEL